VVLAGGRGTRLRPYTVVLPKPLMPIGDWPILEVLVRQLARNGVSRITLAVNHQANLIKAFFGTGEAWNVRIDYSLESEPLSTIAPLRLIDGLPETFLLINGDVLSDLDLGTLCAYHHDTGACFTIAASRRVETIDYGVLEIEGSRLSAFREKPKVERLVSMGIYVVSRSVLNHVPPHGPFGFDDLMHALLAAGSPVSVLPYDGYWRDIGRPDDYMQAIDEFASMRSRLLGE
jgi:NDP-sugar pyrophosphorylase family protein